MLCVDLLIFALLAGHFFLHPFSCSFNCPFIPSFNCIFHLMVVWVLIFALPKPMTPFRLIYQCLHTTHSYHSSLTTHRGGPPQQPDPPPPSSSPPPQPQHTHLQIPWYLYEMSVLSTSMRVHLAGRTAAQVWVRA